MDCDGAGKDGGVPLARVGTGAGFKQSGEPGHTVKRMVEHSPEGGRGASQLIFDSYLKMSEKTS